MHEIAALAELRRCAGPSLDADLLTDWHARHLPAFVARTRERGCDQCGSDHKEWPAKSRFIRYLNPQSTSARERRFHTDITAVIDRARPQPSSRRAPLRMVNLDTGEVTDAPEDDG